MRYRKPVRVPLQTGAESLNAILGSSFGMLFLATGLGSCAGCSAVHDATSTTMLGFFSVAGTFVGALVFGFLLKMARERRASDLLLDNDGVAIEGGLHGGLSLPWKQIDPSNTKIEEDKTEYTEYQNGVRYYASQFVLSDIVVAESSSPDEQRSFLTVMQAITADAAPDGSAEAPSETAEAPASILRCASCGAPIAPADAESVACPSCGARVEIPADLRERVRAASTLASERKRSDQMVLSVLRQPGARRTNLLLASTAVGLCFALPAAVGAAVSHHPIWAASLCAAGVLAILLARSDIATRQALRAVVTGFASRPPAHQGEPSTCRCCGAPLPEPPQGSVVSRCAYCQAANVMGIDLRSDARSATSDEKELESALSVRKREAVIRAVSVAAVAAGVIAVIVTR